MIIPAAVEASRPHGWHNLFASQGSEKTTWEQSFPLEIKSEFRLISSGRREPPALSPRRHLKWPPSAEPGTEG